MTRRRLLKIGVPLAAIVILAATAWAFFTSHGTGAAQASVGSLNAPTDVSVPASSSGSVHVTWTASTLSTGAAPSGYYVTRIKNSDSSTANACGTSQSSLTTSVSCDDTVSTDGTYHYTVTAVFHTWSKTSAASGSVVVVNDAVAPTASITFPSDGGSYNASGWAAGCSTAGLCGSAADLTGVQAVKVSVKRSSDGAYWDGSAFNGTSETFNTAALGSPGHTSTTWSYPLARPADGSYVVHVQTTDTVGNSQSGTTYAATSSFTIDTVAPAVAVTKVNGASASFPYATNQNVTSIGGTCGTASGDGASVSWSFATQSGTTACSSGSWSSGSFPAVSAEGSYTAHAGQSDAAANTGSDDETVKIDTSSPSVAVTKVNGTAVAFPYRTGQDVTSIGGTCATAAGDSATVGWTFGPRSGSASCTSGSWSSGGFAAVSADGTYTAQASQDDSAGNTGSDSHSVTIDKTAPSVAVTQVNGTTRTFPYSTAATVTSIGGTCGTATGDSGSVSWSFSTQSGTASCSSGTWTASFPGVSADGTYTAHASQSDDVGNTGTDDKSVTIDKTGPTVSLSLAANPTGAFLSGSTLFFRGSASGNFKLVASVTDPAGSASATFPTLSATNWTTHSSETVSTPAGGPYTSNTFQWSSPASTPSSYTVTGADALGNTGSAGALTFTPDNSVPTGGSISYTDGSYKTLSVPITVGNGTDAGSGIGTTVIQRDTTTLSDGTCGTFPGSWGTTVTLSGGADTSVTSNNCYKYRYVVTDNVGNQTTYTSASIAKVDATAPAPTNVVLNNSGTAGTANNNDNLVITYSEKLDATTFCSTWTNTGNQTLPGQNAVTVQIANTGSNDTLTVTGVGSNCGGSGNFKLGSVTLGGDYVSTTRTFNGTGSGQSQITWNPTAHTLTIMLGTASGGVNTGVAAGTPTYTPDSALQDLAGNGISTSAFSAPGTSRF